jgi:Gram-negative bacterial TonB protein C-terminal
LTVHSWRAAFVAVAVLLASEPSAIAAAPADFDPEQGAVVDGAYLNPYFGMRYPLPAGWKPGPHPARPSYGGYYVLSTPAPPKDTKATILIAAQDTFFADKPIGDAKATLADLTHSIQEGDTAAAEISSTTIAGHTFARLNVEASPLSRVVFATNIRCHAVTFAFTSADRDQLAQLAAGLGRLSLSAASTAPVCVRDYATAQAVRQRVEPIMVGSQFVKVPVRIVIGSDGKVQHIHVIRAGLAQQQSIVDALTQWEFRPYRANGRAVASETGVTFEFRPPGRAD